MACQVNVFVRIRPVFHKENEEPEEACVRTASHSSIEMINLRNINETLKFDFQQVFNEDSSQEELFGTVVQPVLNHFTDNLQNVSIFAYGPTGSGKTYTILGNEEAPGFIPHAVQHLFARIRQLISPNKVSVTLTMSYIEIYQEKIYDLLASSKKLDSIRQDTSGTIFIPNLTEKVIEKFSDFEKLFVPASKHCRFAQTKINERSSRSHTLLILKLTTQELITPFHCKKAKLTIVDLAGSEDNRLTGNKGVRLKESSSINTSLHVLGKVVDALVKQQPRIPYRDSKLTRLLQDSLGGSAHTQMVVNLSPEMSCIFDTHRALTFAVKSKSVINRPFTRQMICIPPNLQMDKENRKPVTTDHSCVEIFSPAVREKAKKRRLHLDQFDDQGNIVDISNQTNAMAKCSRNENYQKQLIEEIRNSSCVFKKLQQQPEKLLPVSEAVLYSSKQTEKSIVAEASSNSFSRPSRNKSQLFTIKKENSKYFLQLNATPKQP